MSPKLLLKKLLTIALVVGFGWSAYSQDIHFTQFYHNPVLLNPAQAGLACNWRAGINYRTQWHAVTSPYKTMAGYFDIPMYLNRKRSAALGFGVGLFNDVAGSGALTTMEISPTIALHLGFGEDYHKVKFSMGLQPSFRQRKIDLDRLVWEDQFNGTGFDLALPSGEIGLTSGTQSAFDMNGGTQLSFAPNENTSFYGGLAIFHLTKPKESFFSDASNLLNPRKVFHLGGRFAINDKLAIQPNVLMMWQVKAHEINLGGELNYRTTPDDGEDSPAVFGGLYYRIGDALQLLVGGEYNRFRMALTYDITLSQLRVASKARGGFELALMYKASCYPPKNIPPRPQLVCPRF